MGIIGSIIIGCLAGFCAGKLIKGGGFGVSSVQPLSVLLLSCGLPR